MGFPILYYYYYFFPYLFLVRYQALMASFGSDHQLHSWREGKSRLALPTFEPSRAKIISYNY